MTCSFHLGKITKGDGQGPRFHQPKTTESRTPPTAHGVLAKTRTSLWLKQTSAECHTNAPLTNPACCTRALFPRSDLIANHALHEMRMRPDKLGSSLNLAVCISSTLCPVAARALQAQHPSHVFFSGLVLSDRATECLTLAHVGYYSVRSSLLASPQVVIRPASPTFQFTPGSSPDRVV